MTQKRSISNTKGKPGFNVQPILKKPADKKHQNPISKKCKVEDAKKKPTKKVESSEEEELGFEDSEEEFTSSFEDEEINSEEIESEQEGEIDFEEFGSEDQELDSNPEKSEDNGKIKDWIGSDDSEELEDDFDLEKDISEDYDKEDDADENIQQEQIKKENKKLIINTAEEGIEEEDETIKDNIINLSQVNSRIQANISVLSDWKSHSIETTKPRSFYIQQFKNDLCVYFGYSEFLMEKFCDLFPKPSELYSFLEANEMERPVTIRCNTLKCKRKELAQALIARGVNLEPTMEKWNPVGLQIFDSKVPIGATPEYLAGHYMLQAAASFLPVLSMGLQPGDERVLDMCAAPGGKTTFIAALMKNTGCLFANDINKVRLKALVANIHRMGVVNTIVTCMDGKKISNYMKGFDRILLDAPCSGTGVISKDSSVKTSKTAQDIQTLSHLQKELILTAIDALEGSKEKSGVLVYSTCSILIEENEEVVDYALRKRPNVHLEPCGVDFGEEGFISIKGKQFNKSLKLARRYYPHTHNLDGFFVAKLVKTGSFIPSTTNGKEEKNNEE